ncbi:MAG: putative C-S lyase [Opitutaceae bacterium]|nr:putative C-S lyase [Opitutaceae bacterium]
MPFDFDRIIDRRGTGSEKWERYAGRDVLPMWVADMDFASPPCVLEAMHRRVDHGVFGYTLPVRSTVEAIVAHLAEHYQWAVDPSWIVFTPGVNRGMNLVCRAIGERGEAVVVPSPVYPPFFSAVTNSQRRLIEVPLARRAGERWEFDFVALADRTPPDARLLLLCHPHNPVSRAWSHAELARLANFCRERDLWICSDEIHAGLVLDGRKHIPTATLSPEIAARTITLMAPSKTFNLPGLGLAFAIVQDAEVRKRLLGARRGLVPPDLSPLAYAATEAAFRHGEPWRRELVAYLEHNRDHLTAFLAAETPELKLAPVEATYLAWIDTTALGQPEPAKFFEQYGLGLNNGADFGAPGFVRLNFGCPRATLEEGLLRLRTAVHAARASKR